MHAFRSSLFLFISFVSFSKGFYENFNNFKCLGNFENFKVKNFDEIRDSLLKRQNDIHSCSKCVNTENTSLLRRNKDEYNFFDDIEDEEIDIFKMMETNPTYCDDNTRGRILDLIQNEELKMSHESTISEWNKATNLTKSNIQAQIKLNQAQKPKKSKLKKIMSFLSKCKNLNCKEKRMVYPKLTFNTKTPKILSLKNDQLASKVTSIYSNAEICKTVDKKKKCFHYEPGIKNIMDESRDYDERLWAWKSWRDAIGPKVRQDWICNQVITKIGKQFSGFKDIGESWRNSYQVQGLENKIDRLWNKIKPFYIQFHAYIRYQLNKVYGEKVSLDKPIPAHLVGDIWSMNWETLYKIVRPYKDVEDFDITAGLKNNGVTVMKMFQMADEFYKSIGLPPMPKSFWEKSMFVRPKDGRPVVCYASASDLKYGDVRVKMCAEVNKNYFYVAHHEMGHCQYFLNYGREQPYFFQKGANPGFHEAIGDTAALSVMNSNHFIKLGILKKEDQTASNFKKQGINSLMNTALAKLPLFGFALSLEKWRWDFFGGKIKDGKINKRWWERKLEYQGLVPPINRTEEDFDPAAKFHISNNVPYIRYFIAHVLQFQFFETLCKAAGYKGELYNCDISDSKEAGKIFKKLLEEGSSRHWEDILKEFTGEKCHMDTSSVLKYFDPLYKWLVKENKRLGLKIGWQ